MNIIEKIKKERMGFIADRNELAQIIAIDPYTPCLIRANLNRVVVPAHQVIAKSDEINGQENNYVRDITVSFSHV